MSTYSGAGEMDREYLLKQLEERGLEPHQSILDRIKNATTGNWEVTVETEEYEAHFHPHSYTIETGEEGTSGNVPEDLQDIAKRYSKDAQADGGINVR